MKSVAQLIGKNKELIPLFGFVAGAVVLAGSYVGFKSFYDNQVVIDRRNPFPYKERQGVQAGRFLFGRTLGNNEDEKTPTETERKEQ